MIIDKQDFTFIIFGSVSGYAYRIGIGYYNTLEEFLQENKMKHKFFFMQPKEIKEFFRIKYIGKGIKSDRA